MNRTRLTSALVALALAATLAAPASAHRTDPVDYVHEIEHAIRDTNNLREDRDLPAFQVDLSYQELTDAEALLETLRLWNRRFNQNLKKSFWWELALCESGGNWSMKNAYHGGLSFHPGTWAAYRSKRLPKYAYLATPAEQIRVARRVQADQGWEAWPACSARIGLR
ncbi:MAG: transglycosylase family protein [Thermoleophilia bacterium]|nr:transglycosylase family protein [Thermoleophilia bacterium]